MAQRLVNVSINAARHNIANQIRSSTAKCIDEQLTNGGQSPIARRRRTVRKLSPNIAARSCSVMKAALIRRRPAYETKAAAQGCSRHPRRLLVDLQRLELDVSNRLARLVLLDADDATEASDRAVGCMSTVCTSFVSDDADADLGSNGAPERIRTSDPQIRSLVLYPAELRARDRSCRKAWIRLRTPPLQPRCRCTRSTPFGRGSITSPRVARAMTPCYVTAAFGRALSCGDAPEETVWFRRSCERRTGVSRPGGIETGIPHTWRTRKRSYRA